MVRLAGPFAAGVGALCVVATAAGGVAGAATEPAIAVAPKCVINAQPATGSLMAVAGSGFTAGDAIALNAGDASGRATVGTGGTFSTRMDAPTLSTSGAGAMKFTFTARDQTSGNSSAATTFWVANLAFTTKPKVAKPLQVVHFSFSGFKPGKPIYGHYLRGGKVVASHRFGRATGICGLLNAKSHLLPVRNPRSGKYKVQIDDSRRFRPKALPRVNSFLTISPG